MRGLSCEEEAGPQAEAAESLGEAPFNYGQEGRAEDYGGV
mgnify:CR=1 FL=1